MQVQTARVKWTDSEVLHPPPCSHSLLAVHFTLRCLHILLQLINLVTFWHRRGLQQVVHTSRQRGRNQGVSQPHSYLIFAYMWPLLTNLWNCISSPLIMATVRAAEREWAESTLNSVKLLLAESDREGPPTHKIRPNSFCPLTQLLHFTLKCT